MLRAYIEANRLQDAKRLLDVRRPSASGGPVRLSSPAAAQRCAEGAGRESSAVAAAQSAMPSIAASRRTTADKISTWRRRLMADGAEMGSSRVIELGGKKERAGGKPVPRYSSNGIQPAQAGVGDRCRTT